MYLCDFPSVFQGGKLSCFPSVMQVDGPLILIVHICKVVYQTQDPTDM